VCEREREEREIEGRQCVYVLGCWEQEEGEHKGEWWLGIWEPLVCICVYK